MHLATVFCLSIRPLADGRSAFDLPNRVSSVSAYYYGIYSSNFVSNVSFF